MQTLEEKLKAYVKKTKRRELVLPKEMLREAIGNSGLSDVLDEDMSNKQTGYYDNFENIKKYYVKIPKDISIDSCPFEDDAEIIHFVEYYNKEKYRLPFDYSQFYKNNFLASEWRSAIFPQMKIGDLYYTVSPITYLIGDFNDLLAFGAHEVDWDHEIKEGTLVIPYVKIDIDGNMFTKVLYDGKMYWCFGTLAPEQDVPEQNPHYI